MAKGRTRVVILGGGFGGVYTARHLERLLAESEEFEVTLVSRDNYLLMTPLLFEAGSGVLEPRHAVSPIRALFKRVNFIEAEVEGVDFERRVVRLRPSADEVMTIPYDQLVLALGGVTNRAIIPGSEHAMAFKTLADAIFARNYTIELFERASVELDPARRRATLTFVVVGAGLVGVELMGEITEFTKNLLRAYPKIRPEELRFELIEAGPKALPEMERGLADYAVELLRKRGVNVRTSCPVQRIEPDRVHLPNGEQVEAATIVLAAGVAPNPLLKDLEIAKDRKGKIQVDGTMRSVSRPEVWALGDCATIPDPEGKPYPPLAQHALREARVLARNIVASVRGGPPEPFVYETLGTLAALGHYKGVGRVMKLKIRGFLAWWVWRTYYLMQMPRWSRRIRIVLDWTVALLFKHDIVKIDLYGEEHPLRRYERWKTAGLSEETREESARESARPAGGQPGEQRPEVVRPVGEEGAGRGVRAPTPGEPPVRW